MTMEYYVLDRTRSDKNGEDILEFKVGGVVEGADPLYGNGSWGLFAGPFNTMALATAYINVAIESIKGENK